MQAPDKHNPLLTDSILKQTIRLAWPMVIAFLFQTSYNFVDRFFVSRLGDLGTAAIGMAFLVQLVIIALGSGLGVGVNSFIARNLGSDREKEARETALHAMVLGLLVGLALAIIGLIVQKPLFTFLGASPPVLALIMDYLTIIFLFAPIIMVSMLSNNIFRGWGDTLYPMKFMLTGTLLNVILDPLLIFGLGPFPALGIKGAALATGIARTTAFLYLMFILFLRRKPTSLTFKNFSFNWNIFQGIFQVGLPSSISQIFTSLAMSLIYLILKPFGPNAKATYTIVFTYEQFAFLPVIGIAQAVTILTGHNFGAGLLQRVRRIYLTGIGISLAMMTLAGMLVFSSPWIFAGVFARSPEVKEMAATALRITSPGYLFISFYMCSIASFQGLGLGRQYLYANLIRLYLLQVPLAYAGTFLFQLNGVWIGLLAGNVLSAGVVVAWYFRVFHQQVLTGRIKAL